MQEDNKQNVFGKWLDETLRARRLAAAEFAQIARISRGAVYHYICGRRVPDDASLARIKSALGIEDGAIPEFERKKVGRPSHPTA